MAREINMFIVYAREDKDIKLGLLRHLKPLKEAYNLSIWHDDHIEPGQNWKPHIDSRLNATDIFLLLVSVDFMNSQFIDEVEFKTAIDRHKEEKSVMIPVIIDYCQWDIDFSKQNNFNLNQLQVLPDEAKPIGDWKTPEKAFNNIAAGVRRVVSSIKNDLEREAINKRAKKEKPNKKEVSKEKDEVTPKVPKETKQSYPSEKKVVTEKESAKSQEPSAQDFATNEKPTQLSGNWTSEKNFEELIHYPEVRTLISQYASQSNNTLTAREFLGLADSAFDQKGESTLQKLSDVIVPLYQNLGIGTGKSAHHRFNQSMQQVIVKSLCSLVRNGYPLNSFNKAINGIALTATIPADMWTWGGSILMSIEEVQSSTVVRIDAKIKGQLYDWGKSKGVINSVLSDIQQMQLIG